MTDSVALNSAGATTPGVPEQQGPFPAPFDVQVRDASGCGAQKGEVVAADLVLITGGSVKAPAVVDLPDGTQVLAIRVVGPHYDFNDQKCWALEFVPGTIPVREPVDNHGFDLAAASKPFWCGIFGDRLASCR